MKKIKKELALFVKGIILGIAFIIPGVSGGTLAVLLGIYEDLIEAASNFYKGFRNFKKYFMYLLPIVLGVLVSIALCARIIDFGLEKAPIITILVFLGMIIGGIPKLFTTVRKKPKMKEYSFMMIGIIVLLLMLIFDKGASNTSFENISVFGYIMLFLVGILASATMVIPGISGSFTLMLIGYYEPILNVVNELTSLTNVTNNLFVLLPFGLGIVIGIVLISKLIEFLLDKYHTATYYVIIGFVLSSVISVFYQIFQYDFNPVHMLIGTVLMVVNAIFVYKIFEK